MPEKIGAKDKRRKINFVYEAPDAKAVFLSGSFNDWSLKKHPMKNNGKGVWTRTLLLSPGSYEYKYFVDGQWREDPGNERRCSNCFGGMNNVVQVSR